jgi:hypothetical protein
VSRYKYTKLKNLGPVHGFFINTPDGRTIKDIYPQFIVRELNRLNDRINRLEEAGDRMRLYCADPDDCWAWDKARKAKP